MGKFDVLETEVREYFIACPLCGSKELKVNIAQIGKDTMFCENCGARWHLFFSLSAFRWAELEVEADDGKGRELVRRRLTKDEWQRMAREVRRRLTTDSERSSPPTALIKEKETIIKEIVMIPCKYCGTLMPQTVTFCPNCGARRTA
jgi:RNA polymerase subunit RPABC4/transcription elongation factor Spt4